MRKPMDRKLDFFAKDALTALLIMPKSELFLKFAMKKNGKGREETLAEEAFKLALAMEAESDKHA